MNLNILLHQKLNKSAWHSHIGDKIPILKRVSFEIVNVGDKTVKFVTNFRNWSPTLTWPFQLMQNCLKLFGFKLERENVFWWCSLFFVKNHQFLSSSRFKNTRILLRGWSAGLWSQNGAINDLDWIPTQTFESLVNKGKWFNQLRKLRKVFSALKFHWTWNWF